MIAALRELGLTVSHDVAKSQVEIGGCGGRIPQSNGELFLANSGTSIRFLTAMATLGHGRFRLDGIERMRQRPIGDLLLALNQLGAEAASETGNDCPPVVVRAAGLPGGEAKIRGDISSQYLSALLMAAPYSEQGVTLIVDGELVSKPYVRMTLAVMRDFSVEVQDHHLSRFEILGKTCYRGRQYDIEPDASAASYFWAAAAITGGRVTVDGLSRNSLQGDVEFCECLARMGCHVEYRDGHITVTGARLRGGEFDMNAISDTVQTLAAVALYAEGPTTVTGVAHNRFKETDRIADLARELRKLGATVEETSDGMTIVPGQIRPATIETYNDHRMAMSLALVGLRTPGVVITNPGCTAKTYPDYFHDLAVLCGQA